MNTINIVGKFGNIDGSFPRDNIQVTILEDLAFSNGHQISRALAVYPIDYESGDFTLVLAVPDSTDVYFSYRIKMPDDTSHVAEVNSTSSTDWETLVSSV